MTHVSLSVTSPITHPVRSEWDSFRRRLRLGDILVVLLVVICAHLRYLPAGSASDLSLDSPRGTLLAILIAATWVLQLTLAGSYRSQVLGLGHGEYLRVTAATAAEFAGLSLLLRLAGVDIEPGYFSTCLLVGTGGLLVWRFISRQVLVRARSRGRLTQPAYVVGSSPSVAELVNRIGQHPELGLKVVGVFIPQDEDAVGARRGLHVPVLGGVERLWDLIRRTSCMTLMVTDGAGLSSTALWSLRRSMGVDSRLILGSPIVDVAGSRLQLASGHGLSTLEIERPQHSQATRAAKRGLDIVLAAVAMVLALPIWIVVPFLVWKEDRGPVMFRQVRVGKDGKEFRIWKFRTMRTDADAQLAALLKAQGTGSTPLFKVDNDPRITRIGSFLRRSSLDEVPQLLNVLEGSMSLVGPRPQVPKEVALYDATAARRLEVKPGITGMWQVNGRSTLSWQQALRFDLFYVDHWSLAMDLRIMLKTVKVVLKQEGSE